ncbi:pilus assembly protein N-terminal domain-containing protein, partial [bacterium]|nr:pilus assembly protein N-terminal domain-containing protein [bacterium]
WQGTERVFIPLGANRTVNVKNLRRAALANPKVARARAIPPDKILLTAKARGRTVLRTWSHQGEERLFAIEVGSADIPSTESTGVVRVAVELLEIDEALRRETGLHWPEMLQASAQGFFTAGTGLAGQGSFSIETGGTRAWIQQLVREGRGRVLASPELYVRLGEQAQFSSGGEIPVPTTSETYGRLQRHVEWKPFGLSVKIRPESADYYRLHSDIQVEISDLDTSQAIAGIPALHHRKLETKVDSVDGETVLLSGLVRQVSHRKEEGVPVLKDLPILGLIFEARTRSSEKQEILMALTLAMRSRVEGQERWERFEENFHEGL